LILVLCGLREAIMNAIPASLRHAIGIGIGLFIAFIGLKGGTLIAASDSTFITMGDPISPAGMVAILSIILAVGFHVMNVTGGLLWSILIATVVGIPLGVTALPSEWNFAFDFSALGAPFQALPDGGGMALVQVLMQPMLLLFVFSMLMSDFFDTMGTVLAVGQKGEFADREGNVEDLRPILVVDSVAAAVGGAVGASSITTYVESTAGAAAGARTGLSNIVIAIAFILCAFLAPLIGMISSSATCGALVVVGYLMMTEITAIEWDKVELAFPAFMTIVGIPMFYSITTGIGLGFIYYCIIMVFKGRAKEVHPLMWCSALAFLLTFMFAS